MLIRWIERWTMCRWKGHQPWPKPEDSREPMCERCGKALGDPNAVAEPIPPGSLRSL